MGSDSLLGLYFLYCSLFPEDYEISSRQLIQLWIGEGFLDESNNIQEAINEGKEIIASLLRACLLENGSSTFPEGEESVKMHDVIRDMAVWLACETEKKKNKFVVKDGVGLIRGQEVEKWKDTQRISLWNCSRIEEPREPPYFPFIETLFASGMQSFPSNLFTHMPVIRVLDLSNNKNCMELPVEIGNLVTLQYLNLSNTGIKILPLELKNLKKLRCLILDHMRLLKPLPSQMVSGLSSLQLFSIRDSTYKLVWRGDDERRLLEELEQLEHIEDISIELTTVLSAQTLFNSRRLQRLITWLQLHGRKHMDLVQLSPYLEKLEILECDDFEDVKIDLEKEVQIYSKFSNLRDVTILGCENLSNLTWLIYASSLQVLLVQECCSMEK